jgi:glycosyltransferase involved in cell wall biosynthesis
MKYLVCYVWPSTQGNHAGMAHMCNLLIYYYPGEFKVVKFFPLINKKYSNIRLINKIIRFFSRIIYKYSLIIKKKRLYTSLKPNDKVFLLEYLLPECGQLEIAKEIKKRKSVKLIALAHLTPSAMITVLNQDQIISWVDEVDVIMTLGSSLSQFLKACNVDERKIATGFHYVDHNYYFPIFPLMPKSDETLNVIVMGSLQRNYILLENIIKNVSNVNFVVLSGGNNLDFLKSYTNTRILGYVSEIELKDEMGKADISLNVMEDTVGSNVITTSMAMGLVMVVSDVGSIRDYCDEKSAIFCNDENEFIGALKSLNNDREKLLSLKNESLKISEELHIDCFYSFISQL